MAGTERLKVNLVQGENRVQTVVKGQIEVPEAKPDVEKILSKTADAKVRNVSVVPNKVIVEGTLSIQVTYVAFKPDQSVHSFDDDLNFTTYVDVPGAEPGDDYFVQFTVEDVSLTTSRRNPRKFDVAAVLSTFAKITQVDEMEILTETPAGNVALETADLTVEHLIGDKETKQIIVSDVFEVPEEKPEVEKILKVKAEAVITDKRLVANKVIVDGEVRLQILYVAFEPRQSVHDLHHTIRFSAFVEVPDAQPGMNVHVLAEVEAADVEPVIDPALRADVIIKLTVFVSETRTLHDVPTLLKNEEGYTKRKLKVDREIGAGDTQVVLRESIAVPESKPDIMKVLDAIVDHAEITDTKILKGKVIIRGYVNVEIVYVSTEPDQAVHALHQQLNFRTFVIVEDAKPDMDVDVTVEPEFVSADQVGVDVHTEVVLSVSATVTEMIQQDVYVPEEVVPTVTPTETPCPPIDYVVRAGDTLGKIAAAHRVTVPMILELNPQITNPDVIEVGQVIKIPCPAMG
ncbi:LysM domain protein [Pelotomaculum schinkii]|uniref:LysM domain protein n=1 Tax=Pelotomaculum schinkii TaxID=78350 RepID=A0A4Y7RI95_9FIRM|nr:SPOCS domain-containing protein [Pelotomaculum schinkii]TEB08459.1 LysM domain protein [Pelotomaculum schinkii]